MEYERIREKALLTDEELNEVLKEVQGHYYDADISLNADHVAIAKAQVDKALKTDGIEIRAVNQDLPPSLSKDVLVKSLMLTPDSEGRVWRKVIPKGR